MQCNTQIVTLYDKCGDAIYKHEKGEDPNLHEHIDLTTRLPPHHHQSCLLASLLCVHATFKTIPFPVSTSHLYFGYFLSLSMSFEVKLVEDA